MGTNPTRTVEGGFGEVTLTRGVNELVRGEEAFEAMYDGSTEQ